MTFFPRTAERDAPRILLTRGMRGFADGLVSVVLASYLAHLGFSPVEIGAIVTGTLLGSAALTLGVGLLGHRLERRRILLAMSGLMVATGLGFAALTSFVALLLVAVVGTLNPSAGDVTPFLPTEQSLLADVVAPAEHAFVYAWYNLAGSVFGAVGSLAAGLPALLAKAQVLTQERGERDAFLVYSAVGLLAFLSYRSLSVRDHASGDGRPRALGRSRALVLKLAALFALDSFGGGFVVQSLLALWLFRRFELPLATAGAVFFAMGLLGGLSQFVSAWLSSRIGHVRTMVFTHLPSNVFLVLAGVMPTAGGAITFLLLRMALSQMDVPARQAYVMSVVPPEERQAASSVTNVPRSLAAAIAPVLSGWMLSHSSFGWPLIVGGLLKGTYDLVLFKAFAARR